MNYNQYHGHQFPQQFQQVTRPLQLVPRPLLQFPQQFQQIPQLFQQFPQQFQPIPQQFPQFPQQIPQQFQQIPQQFQHYPPQFQQFPQQFYQQFQQYPQQFQQFPQLFQQIPQQFQQFPQQSEENEQQSEGEQMVEDKHQNEPENCVDDLNLHNETHFPESDEVVDDSDYYITEKAFENNIISYGIPNKKEHLLFEEFVSEKRNILKERLETNLLKHNILKFNISLVGEYFKIRDDEMECTMITHRARMSLLHKSDHTDDFISEQLLYVQNKMEKLQERDSGWKLLRILRAEININKSSLVRGSRWISTPTKLQNRRACINIENSDDYCFKWCIIAAMAGTISKCPQRCSSYNIPNIEDDIITLQNNTVLNFSSMQFPLSLKEIKIFEENNTGISVNVFGYEEETDKIIGPFYVTTKRSKQPIHINLIILEEAENRHFIYVKNLSRLLKSQTTTHHKKLFFCNTCMQHSHNEINMTKHEMECGKIVTQMPTPENAVLKFNEQRRQMDVPFTIYADFECILKDVVVNVSEKTKHFKKHIPCAFGYIIKSIHNSSLDRFKMYTGENAAEEFVKCVYKDCQEIYNSYLRNKKQMDDLSVSELTSFNSAKNCHICGELLQNDRVKEYSHISGKYRGAAHKMCNIKFQVPKFIPIYFHNFSSYDSHLFFTELRKVSEEIKIIPLNEELYISLSLFVPMSDNNKLELRFLDTLRFMPESLESLANNLSDDDLITVKSHFKPTCEFALMKKKGIFPYEYLNSFEKLDTCQLPSREDFYNKLDNKECSVEEYSHAEEVWNTFECKTMKDYMELYLKRDVLLLADVFENFRKICKRIYNLDPSQYFTAPGLSWDAMLKTTNVKLDLLTDIDMYNFFKKGIRGGIVQCAKRYSKANNKYLDDFDETKPSEFLMYLDTNNLYGWAMSEYLPYGGFRWLRNDELHLDPNNIDDGSTDGYVYEVDLEYPSDLHDSHNDLPFCSENKQIGESKSKILITDFSAKNSYVIHYRVLKQCLNNGLLLKKVHRILTFKQSPWLKKYIDVNTFYRTRAKNTFEKNFFKLLTNAVCGKAMENLDKRKDVKIVTNWNRTNRNRLGAQDWISKPHFHSVSIFSEDMVAVHMTRVKTCYNKPIYLGFCVLELSKWKMYDFHYGFMKPKFESKLSLNYMDTDSFIYSIQTKDFYNDIKYDIKEKFDTSNYPENNIFEFPLANKMVSGMMKDENCGKIMKEFVGLRSKMYSISIQNDKEIMNSKGIKKCLLSKYSIAPYKHCLFNKSNLSDNMLMFKSKLHQRYTTELNKVILSYEDTKRYVIKDNGINTYAWYHYAIEETNPYYELDMLIAEIRKGDYND